MLTTESGFSEYVYLAAAQERITEANLLLDSSPPAYALACYTAGVAVECIFHAYRMKNGILSDDAKHDLHILAERSGFYNRLSSKERERIGELLGQVYSRWQNNHRYRSGVALRDFVIRHRLFVVSGATTTRRNAVDYHADVLLEAATEIVNLGVARWNNL